MEKQELTRARVESITRFMAEHNGRIAEAVRNIMRDGDEGIPFVLLVPTADGTHTIANVPMDTVAAMLRTLATRMEQDQLRKMFERALSEAAVQIVHAAELAAQDDDDDAPNGEKVH